MAVELATVIRREGVQVLQYDARRLHPALRATLGGCSRGGLKAANIRCMQEAGPQREWPHLPKAPIREAVLDIQVTAPKNTSLRQLESIHEQIKDQYPGKRPRKRIEARFDVATGLFESAPEKTDGFVFLSQDQRQLLQVRLDGFTVHRLAPYATWDGLRDEAKRLWAMYRGAVRPEEIRRIALRYVNRLELPLPIHDFKEYLRIKPDIPDDLPHAVSALFMRLEVPQPRGAIAIISETIEQVEERSSGHVLPFILDIDVIRQETVAPDAGDLWEKFEHLRDIKNQIFFGTITPKAEALFK